MSDTPLIALDAVLLPLRRQVTGPVPLLPLFSQVGASQVGASHSGKIAAGVMLYADPVARIRGTWASPAGRLLEIVTEVDTPGAWFGLHLRLPAHDLAACRWLGIAACITAQTTCAVSAALRTAGPDGDRAGIWRDRFLPRHILAQSRESDHSDLLNLGWYPDLPGAVSWRELVLFLPAAQSNRIIIHDLRIFAL